MGASQTDCRSDEGITVGLIDALMSIARVLAPRLLSRIENEHGDCPNPVQHALLDLEADGDVACIFGFLGAVRKKWHQDHRPPTAREIAEHMLADPELSEEAKAIGRKYIFDLTALNPQM